MAYSKQKKAEWELARYHRRITEARELLGGACVDCGGSSDLQFDHRDPATKSFGVGQGWSRAYETFIAEVKKCELRCGECHRARHSGEAAESRAHGTTAMFKSGCRCDPCRLARNAYMRAYKREWRVKRREAGLPV